MSNENQDNLTGLADDEGALESFFQAIGGEPEVRETDEFRSTTYPGGTEIREYPDGTRQWWVHGKQHREDGPAVEGADGTQEWWLNGKRHRVDGPAYIEPNGTEGWFRNGQLHRKDGPAKTYANTDGSLYLQAWYRNGLRHREDGPAVVRPNIVKEWWRRNQLHRVDGPAVEHANGKTKWYVWGRKVSKATYRSIRYAPDLY